MSKENQKKLGNIGVLFSFLKYIKPFKHLIISQILLSIAFSFFTTLSVTLIQPILELIFDSAQSSATSVASPLNNLSSKALDYLFSFIRNPNDKYATLLNISIYIIIVFSLKNLTKYLSAIVSTKLEEGVIKAIRDDIFRKLMSLTVDYFTSMRQGNIISIISNDVAVINTSTLSSMTIILKESIQIILFMFLLITISPILTLAAFSTSIISLFLIKIAVKFLRRYAERMQSAVADYTSTMSESITGIRVIKSFNVESSVVGKFAKDTANYVKSALKHRKVIELISPLNEMFAIIALCVVLFMGGSQVINGEMSPESLMLFLFTLFSIMNPISSLFNSVSKFQHGIVSAERVFTIMDAEPSVRSGTKFIDKFEDKIEFRNVDFKYKDELILRNINITIPKSKKIAFVGSSGSGKSTMLDLLIRFYDTTSGDILLDGRNIKELDEQNYRSLFGLVGQENILFNETIFNNIAFSKPEASIEAVIDAAKRANCFNFINNLPEKFDTKIGDRGITLSGGERQRIAIARALLSNPDILVFDEATSALDAESEKIVQEAINKSLVDKTAIIVAHRLATIKDCDEIFVFDKGEIVERGTHQQLLEQRGIYSMLCDLQFNH